MFCEKLSLVSMPDSIITIGDQAFSNCYGLESITIPINVTNIGRNAFEACINISSVFWNARRYEGNNYLSPLQGIYREKLLSITLGEDVEQIPAYLCSGMVGLLSVTIPNSVVKIEEKAFNDCSKLNWVIIGNGVKHIGEKAFNGCCQLRSIIIPDKVVEIERCAFEGCDNLTSITIGSNLKVIGVDAFACLNLKTFYISPDNPWYSSEKDILFNKSKSILVRYPKSHNGVAVVPDGVVEIGQYAFHDCSYLTTITIPDSVTSIGYGAFSGCSKLSTINLPPHLYKIENSTFLCCESLISIDIPNGVTSIGEWAFSSCSSLYRVKLPESVVSIGGNAFDHCDNLKEIHIPIGQKERFRINGLWHLADRTREREVTNAYYLFFDTETAGLPPKGKYDVPVTNPDFWPRLVQIAWILTDKEGNVLNRKSKIIYPNGFSIPTSATAIHHITTEHAMQVGEPLRDVLGEFMRDLLKAEKIVCHNVEFDQHIVGAELYSMDMDYKALMDKSSICTKTSKSIIDYCALPNPNEGYDDYKWPKLSELYRKLFNRDFENAHDALADITATKDCFFELKRRGIIKE